MYRWLTGCSEGAAKSKYMKISYKNQFSIFKVVLAVNTFVSATGKVISGQESEIVSSVSSRGMRALVGEG